MADRKRREVGPDCVRNSHDSGVESLEGSGQACCLPFMGRRLWKVKGTLWVLEGRDACLELVLVHVVGTESASCPLSRCLPRA